MYFIYEAKCFQTMAKNLILYGSAGTGKTLLLVETLRIKVAHYKMLGEKPIKIIIGTYNTVGSNPEQQLKQDLTKKYNIQSILEEFEVEPKDMRQLSMGKN